MPSISDIFNIVMGGKKGRLNVQIDPRFSVLRKDAPHILVESRVHLKNKILMFWTAPIVTVVTNYFPAAGLLNLY